MNKTPSSVSDRYFRLTIFTRKNTRNRHSKYQCVYSVTRSCNPFFALRHAETYKAVAAVKK
jgi:hypothetical protein